jgi:hypothetical protein
MRPFLQRAPPVVPFGRSSPGTGIVTRSTVNTQMEGGEQECLSTETDSGYYCEGRVRTCARCGRPASECDGTSCEHVLETRDWMVPG